MNNPDRIQTAEQLAQALDQLRAGTTYVKIERSSAGAAVRLSRSTLGDVLSGKRMPRPDWLNVYLDVCGVPRDAQEAWRRAWQRAQSAESATDVAAGEVTLL